MRNGRYCRRVAMLVCKTLRRQRRERPGVPGDTSSQHMGTSMANRDLSDCALISWMGLIAGGPDHGQSVRQWAPHSAGWPGSIASTDDQECHTLAVAIQGGFRHAIFAHPDVSVSDLEEAEHYFHLHYGVAASIFTAPGNVSKSSPELSKSVLHQYTD
jgi:hypothetical protein